jgi:hypothetical protein
MDVLICQICDADMLKSVQTALALARARASSCVPVSVDGTTSTSPSNAIHRSRYFKESVSKEKHFVDFKPLIEESEYSRQK